MHTKFAIVLAVIVGLVGPQAADAADMPVKAKPPAARVAEVHDWSGVYAGFHVGGVRNEVERRYPNMVAGATGPFEATHEDVLIGFHVGAQKQWGPWVFGVEFGYNTGFDTWVALSGALPPPFIADLAARSAIVSLLTIGPRLGYAWERWMLFVTGGYALAQIHGQYSTLGLPGTTLFPAFSGTSHSDGWFAGIGFEHVVHRGSLAELIFGVEYQHYELGTDRVFTESPVAGVDDSFDHKARGDLVRARLTIKSLGYPWLPR
jgi:outer membrane immunogenic protein